MNLVKAVILGLAWTAIVLWCGFCLLVIGLSILEMDWSVALLYAVVLLIFGFLATTLAAPRHSTALIASILCVLLTLAAAVDLIRILYTFGYGGSTSIASYILAICGPCTVLVAIQSRLKVTHDENS